MDIAMGLTVAPGCEGGSRLDAFDPRARLVCALAFSALLSSLRSPSLLAAASLVPLFLLPCGAVRPLLRALSRLNIAGLVMALLLALTWPDGEEGARMGLLIIIRLNLIAIVLLRMAVAMGPERLDAALNRLGLPEKFRVLLLLTLRGVFLLADRTAAALRAMRLRAPRLKGMLKWRAFASLLASSLVQGADRSERMMMAMLCRGGLGGFAQVPPLRWRGRDTLLCLSFALFTVALLALNLLLRP